MKIIWRCCIFFLLLAVSFQVSAQNRAAYFSGSTQYYTAGDIDVSGDKLTVEALIKMNGTGLYKPSTEAYEIVAKYNSDADINYLLAPDHGEITTTNGRYSTAAFITNMVKDSFYHVAFVYNGTALKFYINGCLFNEVAASGNLVQNDIVTALAKKAAAANASAFNGYLDEVRIWKVARSQADIQAHMLTLPNTTAQNGLIAYYTFEGNAANVQGNAAFDALPVNSPQILPQAGFSNVKAFSTFVSVQQPSCIGNDGKIKVNTTGGIPPFTYSLDDFSYQNSNEFTQLFPGEYTVYIKSAGIGCATTQKVTLTASTSGVNIINADTLIIKGSSVQLNSTSYNNNYNWNPQDGSLSCTDCSNPIATPAQTTTYYLLNLGGFCFSVDSVTIRVKEAEPEPVFDCESYQLGMGTSVAERAIDVAPTTNNQYFVASNSRNEGATYNIVLSKHSEKGTLLWAKSYGGRADEAVRKIAPTKDGGLLVTGQTKSFANSKGEILCFKIDAAGNVVWERALGIGSANGDMGMSIVETDDEGCAVTGILNAGWRVADAVVTKLDKAGNIQWSQRFDRGDGEDAVGIVQKGDTLVVAVDLQNANANYEFMVMKLNVLDGSFITSKKITPVLRGLFNPYLHKNPAGSGYIVSGHTIDGISYANMKHTVINLNDNFEVTNARLLNVSPVSNDVYTGIVPLADGSFLGTATSLSIAEGYVYRINDDHSIKYAKQTNGSTDRRLYRLANQGSRVIAVGGIIQNSQEDLYVTNFDVNGNFTSVCDIINLNITVERPAYQVNSFNWPAISKTNFTNTTGGITIENTTFATTDLCKPLTRPDFTFTQNVCDPKSVQFKADSAKYVAFKWDFGNGETAEGTLVPLVNFSRLDTFEIKLSAQNNGGCWDSTIKKLPVLAQFDEQLLPKDTTICAGDSILIKAKTNPLEFCWQPTTYLNTANTLNVIAKPSVTTTYKLTAIDMGKNMVYNAGFEEGNKGFDSDYKHNVAGVNGGDYFVGSNVSVWNPAFANCKDHTTGSGNMLMVNGTDTSASKIWMQNIQIQPNTNYMFAVWAQSLSVENPLQLKFAVNGKKIGDVKKVSDTTCLWNRYYIVWNSGNITSASLSLTNNNVAKGGNNFAIDDIYFGALTTKTDSITINVANNPVISVTNDTIVCKGASLQLSAQTEAGNLIRWSPAQYLSDSTIANPIARPLSKITYMAEAMTAVGCRSKDSVVVDVDDPPVIALRADTAICIGNSVVLQNTITNYISYKWQPAGGLTDVDAMSPEVKPLQTTMYMVDAKSTYCTVKDSVTITINQLPVVTITADTAICENVEVQLMASGGTKYQWQPAASLSSDNVANPVAKPTASTLYKVQVIDGNNCVQYDSVMVSIKQKPVFRLNEASKTICVGDTVSLSASGADSYNWFPNSAITPTTGSVVNVFPTQTTQYKVVFTSNECNIQDSAFATVTVRPTPTLSVTKSNDIDCSFGQVQLLASSNAVKYDWSPSISLSASNVANPIATPSQTTTYTVKASSAEGCSVTGAVTVNVTATAKNDFHIPNAFSPNNDGINDCFGVRYWGQMTEFKIDIYDRWGKKVFTANSTTQCWNGKLNGVDQPSGTYVYYIQGSSVCGSVAKKGTITLVR